MKIAIASDHAGFDLKEKIKTFLLKKKIRVRDYGTFSLGPVDYPVYAKKAALSVSSKKADRGILVCGSGIGMSMAANKVKKIRAAACESFHTAKMSRKHNDSNVLCLGARLLSAKKALKIVDIWLKTGFEGGRHLRRVRLLG
ncbi:MAG: ribose 5-phosphate isomerase B [Candidatus Saganbacteria bacterium]|nr:ribose 5-phosphate isomerase B [Candidatus Saganbacteria bacterium]